jgi:hypothetical protein
MAHQFPPNRNAIKPFRSNTYKQSPQLLILGDLHGS